MFRPQIQKTKILVLLTILNLTMVYWSLTSFERFPTFGYDIKKNAVEIMISGINVLRSDFKENLLNSKDNNLFGDFLIGSQTSIIQTTKGSLISKQSTLNPDFAAMITEMLMELEIDSSKNVAVSMTGSYPGANIAVLSALEALKVNASIISSCGSSEYGATNPEMTWFDIETSLFNNNIINNKTEYGSIGGGLDIGSQLSTDGLKACEESMYDNDILLLDQRNDQNINTRFNYYVEKYQNKDIELFINVGGGIYSIGDSLKRKSLLPGIIYPGDINSIENKTLIERFSENNIPVININQISLLTDWYELPYPPNIKNQHSIGSLFYSTKQYNPIIIIVSFLISSSSVLIIGIISHRQIKERMHSIEPDSIL